MRALTEGPPDDRRACLSDALAYGLAQVLAMQTETEVEAALDDAPKACATFRAKEDGLVRTLLKP
ncbi:hypothetical protein [Streptomyces sp. NPDC052036]|uniref:hypothetical protein n=1 Tax=Streptomyces sp. NPDC052036 TaxID=3155171 RepID=UPI003445B5B4